MVRPNSTETRVVDIFDEINEDLRAERAQALLKRYGVLLAVALVLVILGVGGWQLWRSRAVAADGQVAAQFLDAMRKATPPAAGGDLSAASRTQALAEFSALSGSAPEGYRTLARIRAASLKITAGDRPGGLALLDQVSADTGADPLLRSLADLLWVLAQVDDGDPAAVEGRLATLVVTGNAWRPMAMECQAWLLMRTGRTDQARDMLKRIQADPLAPAGVRDRSGWMLIRLGEPQGAAGPETGAGTGTGTGAGTGVGTGG